MFDDWGAGGFGSPPPSSGNPEPGYDGPVQEPTPKENDVEPAETIQNLVMRKASPVTVSSASNYALTGPNPTQVVNPGNPFTRPEVQEGIRSLTGSPFARPGTDPTQVVNPGNPFTRPETREGIGSLAGQR